ncbi:autotransporter outer membrane beta-barrel domain-containing protein [Hyphomicrobium sp.]|uniref:autotransporter outer membrane beta-barrel domain-containing protein n=1 Tax=Hyphomicrobium sp. TaxID=82 RepID=UPI003F71E6B0
MLFTSADATAQTYRGVERRVEPTSGGKQFFYNYSSIRITGGQYDTVVAISGGKQKFFDGSLLFIDQKASIVGGEQEFYNQSYMNLGFPSGSDTSSIEGGSQSFFDNARLELQGTIVGGTQRFYDQSSLRFDYYASSDVSAGLREFYGDSRASILSGGISGGVQYFFDRSKLVVDFLGRLTGGAFLAYDTATISLHGSSTREVDVQLNGNSKLLLGGTVLGRIGGVGTIQPNTLSDGDLTVDGTVLGDSIFAGVMSDGNGHTFHLTKSGAGSRLTLSGTNTYTGTTTVDGGSLIVNGSIASSSLTEVNGRLGGSGTVGNVSVRRGGVIAPGNSIDTLKVNGDLWFNRGGGTYDVEIDPNSNTSDLIVVSGTAFLNSGKVRHVGFPGPYALSSTYTILTAGAISGTFTFLEENFAFLDAKLAYSATDVTMTLERNAVLFAAIGQSDNQDAAGSAAERLGAGHAIHDALLGLDAAQAQRAFDALSGDVHASAQTALIEDSRFVRNAAMDRVRAAFDGDAGLDFSAKFAGWGQAFGSWGDSDGAGASVSRTTGGVLTGIDGVLFDTWRAGFLTGYSRTSFNARERGASGDSDSAHVGLYGGTQWAALGLRGGAAYSWNDIETKRHVVFPAVNETVTSEYDSGTAQVFGEVGYRFGGPVSFEPFAGLAHVSLDTERHRETGGAAALSGRGVDTDVTFSTLGVRGAFDFALGTLNARAHGLIGWRHAYGNTTPIAFNAFAGGAAFAIAGVPIAEDTALIEAGLDMAVADETEFTLLYAGQIANDAQDHGVKASLNVRF